MAMQTLIVSTYSCTGATTAVNSLNIMGYKAIEIDPSKFKYISELPTEEEVEQYKKEYIESKQIHLMGMDYFVNKYRETPLIKNNPDYPKNMINYIKDKDGEVHVITLPLYKELEDILEEYNIFHLVAIPDKDFMYEYIGRAYVNNHPDLIIDTMMNNWKKITDENTYKQSPTVVYIETIKNNFLIDMIKSYI